MTLARFPGEAAAQVAVPTGQIQHALPAYLAREAKQRGVNQRPVPEIPLFPKVVIPPFSHVVPTRATHGCLLLC
jgi:hypothetical protein